MNRSWFRVRGSGSGFRVLGVLVLAALVSAHVGSPDVFFTGKAGAYDVTVIVRPPEVVPGIARVTVRVPKTVTAVSIRPVYWRAGAKGAPSADALSAADTTGTYEGSLWLMARGAYSVDVSVQGSAGAATVTVPVASVATGRLPLDKPLGAVLVVLGLFLVAGLLNIIRKGAGEGLLAPGKTLSESGVRTTRIAGVVGVAILALAVFGMSTWWNAVDRDYESTIYRPSPLQVQLVNAELKVAATDTQYLPSGRASGYVPDHGKLMHLFMIKQDDARAFAHLHPRPDSATIPAFTTTLPALPAGKYFLYGDVVQETGFERTMRGTVELFTSQSKAAATDPDDAWYAGDASTASTAKLADGSVMTVTSKAKPVAGEDLTFHVSVSDAAGKPVALQPYLGMTAHAVVFRLDGEVYVHLHPMGTVTAAAQDVFATRNRGDTTASGRLLMTSHANMAAMAAPPVSSSTSFPYAFPKPGDYRLFVQVKRSGRVLTGAFAIPVGSAAKK